jgi:dolichol-phosphate mannosyltransferase
MGRPGRALSLAQATAGALVLARLARGRVRRPPLGATAAPPATGTISVVVPARDEQARLGPCLEGLLGDPDLLEVLVVDDRSSDGTAALAHRLGARVLRGAEPPPGWTGKAWALQQGIEAARGDWVLHLDADARPRPGLARAIVAAALANGDDLLSAGPSFRCATVPDLVLHPAFLATIPYRFGPTDVPGRRPRASRASLNGQCVLLRRAPFLAAGGYGRVRAHMTEDAALARSLAAAGWAVGFVAAGRMLEVEMYASARETWRGWGRSVAMPDATPAGWQALDVATLWLTMGLPPLKLVACRAGPVDAVLLALRALMAREMARGYRPPTGWRFAAPLVDPLVCLRFTWSVLVPERTWRGRTYGARGRAHRPGT